MSDNFIWNDTAKPIKTGLVYEEIVYYEIVYMYYYFDLPSLGHSLARHLFRKLFLSITDKSVYYDGA